MRVTIFQQNVVWASPEVNIRKADVAIDAAPKSDVYVFPEMFSTGFMVNEPPVCEETEGGALLWMKQKAADTDAAIAGSVAVRVEGHCYNRFYFVRPDGVVTSYDKRHLFTKAGEPRFFEHGRERKVAKFRGVRFLLQVCYDLRFPVFSRNCSDYDAILYVANWPASRVDAWNTLLRARALENQCFVVGVNRTGSDEVCEYCGASAIISPYGKPLAVCSHYEEQTATAMFDMEQLECFRKKFPVLVDADSFELDCKSSV